jgi:hypothetical protein
MGLLNRDKKIIAGLSGWIEKEWLFERSLTSTFFSDKEAFQRGCERFDRKKFNLPSNLYINLKREFAFAELARERQNLLKYAFHNYRMVEIIFNLIFSSNVHNSNKSDFTTYLRNRIFKYLNQGKYNFLVEHVIEYELISVTGNTVCKNLVNSTRDLSFGHRVFIAMVTKNVRDCILDKRNNPFGNVTFQMNKERFVVDKSKVSIRNSKPALTEDGYYMFEPVKRMIDQERVFKKAFYFSNQSVPRRNSVQLNAFFSMKFYRDLYTHNVASFAQNPKIDKPSFEDTKYIEFPEAILESDYYERYIDNVIGLYADFLINPHL